MHIRCVYFKKVTFNKNVNQKKIDLQNLGLSRDVENHLVENPHAFKLGCYASVIRVSATAGNFSFKSFVGHKK